MARRCFLGGCDHTLQLGLVSIAFGTYILYLVKDMHLVCRKSQTISGPSMVHDMQCSLSAAAGSS